MKITATQDFLDGADRYVDGQDYEVEAMVGGYFVRNGWATSPDAPPEWSAGVTVMTPPADAEVTLEPHDAVQDSTAPGV